MGSYPAVFCRPVPDKKSTDLMRMSFYDGGRSEKPNHGQLFHLKMSLLVMEEVLFDPQTLWTADRCQRS